MPKARRHPRPARHPAGDTGPARAARRASTAGPGPRELFHSLAGDLADAETVFDAERMLSTILGMVYRIAEVRRAEAVTEFAEGLGHFARQEGAVALWAAVDALLPELVPGRPDGDGPPWEPALAGVRPTGAYAYGDVYGDQVSYLATFAYADEACGGPEHAVLALVDHNLGFAKDLFVSAPAAATLASVRELASANPLIWYREVAPGELRAAVTALLANTDELIELPESESLSSDRAFALARLALLPQPDQADHPPAGTAGPAEDRAALFKAFRASAAGRRLAGGGADPDSLDFCLDLIVEWAGERRDGRPLRWSPAAVELFLLDWAPRATVLDKADIALLPQALDAWVAWAGRRCKLPAAAVRATREKISAASPEFARLAASGEARGPAAQLVAEMLAEGVDLDDVDAVERWVARHNAATEAG
ncbi:MAG TPA: hypothetical protein VFM54_20320 [Micromonosporaceae bacterium]|nr:hypothetical protein [Micromonosporaceae bacterium]